MFRPEQAQGIVAKIKPAAACPKEYHPSRDKADQHRCGRPLVCPGWPDARKNSIWLQQIRPQQLRVTYTIGLLRRAKNDVRIGNRILICHYLCHGKWRRAVSQRPCPGFITRDVKSHLN